MTSSSGTPVAAHSLSATAEKSSRPHLALIAVQLMFGTLPLAAKLVLRVLSDIELVSIRIVGAAIAFMLLRYTSQRAHSVEGWRDYARLALYSLLGVVINQFLFIKGLSLSTAINATVLGTAIPVFTLLAGALLGYERMTVRKVCGVLLAACGVVYLIDPLRTEFSGQTNLGNTLLVINAFSYGIYIALSQRMIQRYGALTVITWMFLFASAMTIIAWLFLFLFGSVASSYESARVNLASVDWLVWLAMLYIILVPTVGSYYLNSWALERVAPSTVAVYVYLQPLIAFALAPLLLGEQLGSRTWIATALIFAGVGAVIWRSARRDEVRI